MINTYSLFVCLSIIVAHNYGNGTPATLLYIVDVNASVVTILVSRESVRCLASKARKVDMFAVSFVQVVGAAVDILDLIVFFN